MSMMPLFRRPRPTLDHPFLGRLTFMSPDYWEGELVISGLADKVGLVIPAPGTGPVEAQVELCRRLLGDPAQLLERCRAVFEEPYETWVGRPLPEAWKDDFALVGLGLPEGGDEAAAWDVCYFVDAASHYFTAYFEAGVPTSVTVDG